METFSKIIERYFKRELRMRSSIVYRKYIKDQSDIKRSSFYNYCNGTQVPDYKTAAKILELVDLKYDTTKLLELLEDSKTAMLETRYFKNNEIFSIRTGISIKFSDLYDEENGINLNNVHVLIQQRVEEIGKNSFSGYVTKLIREDLLEISRRNKKR